MERGDNAYGLRLSSIFLIALSLSIGWGIRGNFGHEAGAMIAGVLAAIAACLLSGREDWRRRVAFFAMFGGLGWAFGGSISYMYPISFAGSEQWASCIYGFLATFLVGLLWAGPGGMGTALPAVMDRQRLNAFIVPVVFVLVVMWAGQLLARPWLEQMLRVPGYESADGTWHRHLNALYWLDADWFSACLALFGVCLFDLWNRRFSGIHWLLVLAGAGAACGTVIYALLETSGLAAAMADILVVPLGDSEALNPETGAPFGTEYFLTNWPNFMHYYPRHLGWILGAAAGTALYFLRFGKWRDDSKLILYLAGGWLLAFLLLPVFGSIPLQSIGGLRLTPPRSDDWAGILGLFVAALLYCRRHGLERVAWAGSLTGIMGGALFAFIPFLRALLRLPGHPWRTPGGAPPEWLHYHSANWHSIMEQLHGFGHGIALAITIGLLAKTVAVFDDRRNRRHRQEIVAVAFVLFVITFLNVFKNVEEWTEKGLKVMPAMMKAPLFESVEMSASIWFLIPWCFATAVAVALMCRHIRRPVALLPDSWLGRGQLFYLAFLWIMVIANFERALPSFTEGRLVTEWVIIINALLASLLILILPRSDAPFPEAVPAKAIVLTPLSRLWLRAIPAVILALVAMAALVRLLYGTAPLEAPGANHKRWGDEAQWRIRPILKHGLHR